MSDLPSKEKLRALQDTYRAVFDTADGTAVLNHLMRQFHVVRSEFVNDALINSYREGQRSVVLAIIRMVERDFDKQAEIIKENYAGQS